MMNNKEHLTKKGLDEIAKLISKMNRKPKLKYLESSETIRQTSQEEDIVRPVWRHTEITRNDNPS